MSYPDSMQLADAADDSIEQTYAEGKQPSPGELAKHWERELTASTKWLRKFADNARKIERKYTDKRDSGSEGDSHYNIFWANVQVILSAVYGRLPKADCERAYHDFDDDVARVASTIIERILNHDITREYDNTQSVMRDCLQDRFIAGMGQAWVRYEAQTQQVDLAQQMQAQAPAPGMEAPGMAPPPPAQPIMAEVVVNEEAVLDYVRWEDFCFSPCRRWRDRRWVARRSYMTRQKLVARFGEKIGQALPLKARSVDKSEDDPLKASPQKQAEIWEIWCQETGHVYWHCKGYDVILDYKPDFLGLEGFFPCPEPAVATTGTDAFLPTADYILTADQYEELNEVCFRIMMLTKAVRVAGVYDKNNDGIQRILNEGMENKLVPVDNWAMFAERGGIKGSVDWFPTDMVTDALMKLKDRKRDLLEEIYELLGISDIMRGVSVASETATAQSLKVQYGGARVANLQSNVARFVGQCLRLRAEVIAMHFQPKTIMQRSQIDKTPDAQYAQAAIALLKTEGMASVRLSVNADSMAAPDWQAEKEMRTEYVGTVAAFIERTFPLMQAMPPAMPFLMKILQWAAAGFRGGKQVESVLDQAIQALTVSTMQPKPPPEPSPSDKKDLASAEKSHADAQRTRAEITLGTGMPAQAFDAAPAGPPPGAPQPPPGQMPGLPPAPMPQQPPQTMQ